MPYSDDSLGDQTLGGDNNENRFENSLGDERTMADSNIEDDWAGDDMEMVDLSTRYTEEGVLGKGGMGEVLLATDTRLNRKVAIKRILGKAVRSKTATKRFLTEAQSIAALNHNNIVQIYDYGCSTEGPFLIMECVQGGSLLDKCKEGPIELEEAVNIFSQLCDGLAKAHAANIIHRDIKPANVLISEDGVPKLTDFGLAKNDTADTGMTMEGAVIGTLDFMPPEQREGAHLTDHRSDLWSLAATFYQMLTGKSPKVINITELPGKLQSVVAKSLNQAKDDRFQTAIEMRAAILQAYSGKMETSLKPGEGECPESADSITGSSAKKSTRFPVKKFILSLVGLAMVTGIWLYVGESARQQKRRNLLEQPQEDIESANQTDDSHPLDPILKIAYQSIKELENEIVDYTAVLSRRERIGEQEMPPSAMEVKIRNPQAEQAFSIYVKFTEPENTRGREVIWVDGKNENKIVAHETGILGLLRVVQAPDSFVAMVGNRYPITETGLLRLMQKLTQYGLRDRKYGDCDVEIIEEIEVADVSCTRLRIIHPKKQKPFTFHIAEIDMDMQRMIPVRLATWDWPTEGQAPALIEEYIYHNIKLNVGLKDIDFDPDNPAYDYPE